MVSISDLYEPKTKTYYKAVKWLHTYAKHEPIRKGGKTYWHEDDVAAFKARKVRTNWPRLLQELFAEPTTIHDALNTLAERGKLIELRAMHQAVYTYEGKGMLKKAGKQKGLKGWRVLWVFVRD